MRENKLHCIALLFLVLIVSACARHPVLHDFKSDGCSLFPDGDRKDRKLWCDCCFIHDTAYWRGGTQDQRKHADKELRDCVLARTGDKALAGTMYRGVRIGGHPAFPVWYRWGYGWTYGRGYQALSADEQAQANTKITEFRKQGMPAICDTPP